MLSFFFRLSVDYADHPFMFMIIDNKTKGFIFMGKYVKEK